MGNASLSYFGIVIPLYVFIFRPENQFLKHSALICHLLHVSAVFGHRQVFFKTNTWKSIPRWKLSLRS